MKVICLSVDLVNPDKPAASLAFLCGICERAGTDYHAISFNSRLLRALDHSEYYQVYNALKLKNFDVVRAATGDLLEDIAVEITD